MLDLQDFADEIFLEIFSNLLCPELARACHLSRRLGALAQYVLYRTPSIVGSQTNEFLEQFLRTILSRPLLARYIRHLTLDGLLGQQYPLSDTYHSLFTSAARRLELPYSMELSDHLLQLLLHLLPNLHALTIVRDISDRFHEFIMDNVIDDQTSSLPVGFRSLRHVHFSSNGRVGLTPNMLMNLFRLPRIRTIAVHIASDFTLGPSTGFSSTVTQLTLRSASLSICSLAQIFQIPRALTHLSLAEWDILDTPFHGPELGQALQCVSSTLQHLQLSIRDYTNMGPTVIDDWQPNTVGSFRNWPVLTTLRCPLTLLLGQGPEAGTARLVDALPLGIKELEIEADQHWSRRAALDEIVDLVDRKDMCGLENLAVVTVGRKLASEVGPVGVACSAAGVRLMVSSTWW